MRRSDRRPRLLVLLIAAALTAGIYAAPAAAADDRGTRAAIRSTADVGPRAERSERGAHRIEVGRLRDGATPPPSVDRAPLPAPASPDVPSRGLAAVPPAPTQASTAAYPAIAAATVWSGMANLAGAEALEPPDPWVAAGPDHVMQAVNTRMRISSRTGTTLLTVPLFDFFGLSLIDGYEAEVFDPRVIYDSFQGRWLAIEASFDCYPDPDLGSSIGTGYIDVAISDTADPTGTWTSRSVAFPDAVPDYPGLGTTTDKVILSSNVYALVSGGLNGCDVDGSETGFLGTEIDVISWTDLRGTDAVDVAYFTGGDAYPNEYFSWRPALQAPATAPTGFVIGQSIVDGSVAFTKISGAPPALTTLAPVVDLTEAGVMTAFAMPPAPAQPGSPATIAGAVDQRPTDAVWQNGRLAFVSTYPCDPSGGPAETRDCVRIGEVTTASTTPTRRQDLLIAESGADLYMGGVGYAGNGDLHAVWTRSSASAGQYASIQSAYQAAGGAGATISDRATLQAGSATYPGVRWGDYVGVGQDPKVPNAVWAANQYASGSPSWSTRVTQLQSSGATYTPIAPLRVLDSRSGVGVTGAFTSSSAREFVVAGFTSDAGSIPSNAVAVTGNLTVTGQTAKGYVSVTTTPTANPTTSTINFPLGDTRANNVTVPVSASGRLSAVYKGSSGAKAHVIFDVTGYFLTGTSAAGYTPMTPVRALDTRPGTSIGLSGAFQAGTPRKLTVAGVKGVPADAVAITANLTVVGQSKKGYVSVTSTNQPNPSTSTINFPLGDTRANGLTARLDGGAIWLVYKAGAGGTTHLVLDITGYYRPSGAGLAFFPLDPGRIMDTRTNLLSGLSGRFTSGTPRTLDTDGHWGVPAGAEAITGNLTVTGQTAKGYVSGTPTAVATPTTSTINFPKGDTRANGITVPLAATGNQAFVYKASSGSTTHLILDVTGYFK